MSSDDSSRKRDYSSVISASLHKRDERLEKLLTKLYLKDPLYKRNVPVYFRETYNDEKLLTHLHEAYSPLEFFVTNADEILNYIKPGDKAIAKKTITDEAKFVKAYELWFVTGISGDKNKMSIIRDSERLKKTAKEITVPTEKFSTIGAWSTFDSRYAFLAENRMLLDSVDSSFAIENFKKGIRLRDLKRGIKKKDVVIIDEYTDFSEYHIPKGSEGVIAGYTYDRSVFVFWLPNPELKATILGPSETSIHPTKKHVFRPNEIVTMNDIILVKQNTVDFEKMYTEIYHPPEV